MVNGRWRVPAKLFLAAEWYSEILPSGIYYYYYYYLLFCRLTEPTK